MKANEYRVPSTQLSAAELLLLTTEDLCTEYSRPHAFIHSDYPATPANVQPAVARERVRFMARN